MLRASDISTWSWLVNDVSKGGACVCACFGVCVARWLRLSSSHCGWVEKKDYGRYQLVGFAMGFSAD
mgnify:CR=1 FL=1